jgi:glycosyltransferase involved in cell wall biosynthesis
MNKKIVLGVLAFNEENYIEKVITDLISLNLPILVINDFSTDNTEKIIRKFLRHENIKLINNPKNLGAGESTKILLETAKKENFDFLIKVDGDNQFSIKDIKKIKNYYLDHNYEFIKSNRFWKGGIEGKIPKIRFFGNLFATILMQISAGTNKLLDPLNGLFGISLDINKFLDDKNYPKRYGYPYFLTVAAVINHFKTYQINNTVAYKDQKSQINSFRMFFLLIKLTFLFYFKKLKLKKITGSLQRAAFFDIVFLFLLLTTILFFILLNYLTFYAASSLLSSTSLLIIFTFLIAVTIFVYIISFREEIKIRNKYIKID